MRMGSKKLFGKATLRWKLRLGNFTISYWDTEQIPGQIDMVLTGTGEPRQTGICTEESKRKKKDDVAVEEEEHNQKTVTER